jgi:lipid-A-disaccharide synthase
VTESELTLRPPVIGIIAGESSGDQLGARLMRALVNEVGAPVRFVGVGGPLMVEAGLDPLFPMADIAVNGLGPVIRRLPLLLRRMEDAAVGIARSSPDVVIHIDAQDFNQRVAAKLKRRMPGTPLVGYVSPTVWAWRPGRARKIAGLYDVLMAVLPFEEEVHRRLGGPPTVYVGHPLMERLSDFTPDPAETEVRNRTPGRLLVLPGSRQAEISRLLPVFGEAVAILTERFPELQVALPAVPHLRNQIIAATSRWPCPPTIVSDEAGKLEAFRTARAALAASGTVTLELAVADVPTVVAYKVGYLEGEIARRLISVDMAALPSLILGRKIVPEFIDWGWTAQTLADAVAPLLVDGPERQAQLDGFSEVRRLMGEGVDLPSRRAASLVLKMLGERRSP